MLRTCARRGPAADRAGSWRNPWPASGPLQVAPLHPRAPNQAPSPASGGGRMAVVDLADAVITSGGQLALRFGRRRAAADQVIESRQRRRSTAAERDHDLLVR